MIGLDSRAGFALGGIFKMCCNARFRLRNRTLLYEIKDFVCYLGVQKNQGLPVTIYLQSTNSGNLLPLQALIVLMPEGFLFITARAAWIPTESEITSNFE